MLYESVFFEVGKAAILATCRRVGRLLYRRQATTPATRRLCRIAAAPGKVNALFRLSWRLNKTPHNVRRDALQLIFVFIILSTTVDHNDL